MWDSVPWFIEGGAEHSPQVARLLSYAAFGGREGIIGPRDLEVRALSVPGTSIRVFPGACSILNRATGATYEAYVGRQPSLGTVAIAPTDASGGRSDLIVALVKNPWLPGEPWPDPSDVKNGPYIDTAVISGVGGNVHDLQAVRPGWSAITLARIDIPVSTGTITQAMITDLRYMSQVRSSREMLIASPTNSTSLTSTSFVDFPNTASCRLTIDVPEWATHAKIRAIVGGIKFGGSGSGPGGNGWNCVGDLRIQFGGGSQISYGQFTSYNLSNEGGVDRTTMMAGAPTLGVPKGDRGLSTTIRLEGRRTSGNTPLVFDSAGMMSLEVEWVQQPEANE